MIKILINTLKKVGIAVRMDFRNGEMRPSEGYKIEGKWTLHYFNLKSEDEFIEEVIACTKKNVIIFVKENKQILLDNFYNSVRINVILI